MCAHCDKRCEIDSSFRKQIDQGTTHICGTSKRTSLKHVSLAGCKSWRINVALLVVADGIVEHMEIFYFLT